LEIDDGRSTVKVTEVSLPVGVTTGSSLEHAVVNIMAAAAINVNNFEIFIKFVS
jgi:hypothetical protein